MSSTAPLQLDTLQDLKNTMACWSTGVTVVTTHHQAQDWGITCNSFSIVSLEPALVLWSIKKASYSHAAFVESGAFTVNILSSRQHDFVKRFTQGSQGERFANLATTRLASGRVCLPQTLAWFDCAIEQTVNAGDHSLLIGRVLTFGNAQSQRALLYSQRQFGQLQTLNDS